PLELYNSPENKFVAGFIGSPAMNFMECKLEKNNNQYELTQNQNIRINLGERLPAFLDKYLDRRLIVGIRPEHIGICGPEDAGDIKVQVTAYENMGNEQIIYFSCGDASYIVRRQTQDEVALKTFKTIRFKRDKIIYFDSVSEEKIC
ncbi:MAG TPA: TOBE domain-containing protein, partial [Chitinophagaceae bacterium]